MNISDFLIQRFANKKIVKQSVSDHFNHCGLVRPYQTSNACTKFKIAIHLFSLFLSLDKSFFFHRSNSRDLNKTGLDQSGRFRCCWLSNKIYIGFLVLWPQPQPQPQNAVACFCTRNVSSSSTQFKRYKNFEMVTFFSTHRSQSDLCFRSLKRLDTFLFLFFKEVII